MRILILKPDITFQVHGLKPGALKPFLNCIQLVQPHHVVGAPHDRRAPRHGHVELAARHRAGGLERLVLPAAAHRGVVLVVARYRLTNLIKYLLETRRSHLRAQGLETRRFRAMGQLDSTAVQPRLVRLVGVPAVDHGVLALRAVVLPAVDGGVPVLLVPRHVVEPYDLTSKANL
jgi:hypothetical protein